MKNNWLNNIKKLDSKNHLKHGEIYARDGSVYNLNIDNNKVTAEVKGAPDDVYNVEIIFKKLSKKDKKTLTDLIKLNPVLYSKLLNNEIPHQLFESNVKIFPDSLKDFKMSCSCEGGLFCKHKAAVFHKLGMEIKKNQFLLFSLVDFDLNNFVQDETFKIKNIRQILKQGQIFKLDNLGKIDYLTRLKLVLTDNPSFFPSKSVNFGDVICDTLDAMSLYCNEFLNIKSREYFVEYIILQNLTSSHRLTDSKSKHEIQMGFEEKWSKSDEWKQFKIDINGNYDIIKIVTGTVTDSFLRSELKYPLFAFFAELSQISFDSYCDDIKFLHELYFYTLKLINRRAFIPQFFKLDNNEYHIRWIPFFDERIYAELDDFIERCPDNLVTFYETKLSKYNQVLAILSLFFEGYTKYFINRSIPKDLSIYVNETYFRLFFIRSQDFSSYIYNGKEMEIDNWISPIYLIQEDYQIVINTFQEDFKFYLNLMVRINGELLSYDEIVDLNKIEIIKKIAVVYNIFSRLDFNYDFTKKSSMDLKQYTNFYENVAPVLKVSGIEVEAPSEFSKIDDVKLVLEPSNRDVTASLTLDDLADFDWKVAIGDEKFTIDEFKTYSANFRGLIKIRNKYYVIDDVKFAQLLYDMEHVPDLTSKTDLLNYLLSQESDGVEIDERLDNLLDSMFNIKEVNVPDSLNGTLREYQKTGFSWLVQNMEVGFGSILADDMGLGKTIQVLSLILYLKEKGDLKDEKVLIVAPTSILTNWAMEIEKFAPSLNYVIYHGVNRYFPEEDYDILLTSYGIVRRDFEDFNEFKWCMVVVDEAQNIKNPNTKQTIAVKSINTQSHIALSGTPIENHLGEYWSIFDFTNKGYLGTLSEFRHKYMGPITIDRSKKVLEEFKLITSPFILRRVKTDKSIIKELPDKLINDVYCNLTVKQASLYDEVIEESFREIEESIGIERKGLVLKLINSLKQICNHPSQFLKINDFKINESGKMEMLVNILETIIESGEKVLIFTQYVQMGHILKDVLEKKFKQEVLFLHGSVPRTKRDEMIDNFQNGKPQIFLLSLRAGGIGLNLTAASNVIHYDLWWNPAVENQATDRAYRIGQKSNVMVYRFITKGTLEERINQVLFEKRELVDMAIGSETAFVTEMDDEELKNLLDLRKN